MKPRDLLVILPIAAQACPQLLWEAKCIIHQVEDASQEFKVLLPKVDPEVWIWSLEKGACLGSNASYLESSLIKWFLGLSWASLRDRSIFSWYIPVYVCYSFLWNIVKYTLNFCIQNLLTMGVCFKFKSCLLINLIPHQDFLDRNTQASVGISGQIQKILLILKSK